MKSCSSTSTVGESVNWYFKHVCMAPNIALSVQPVIYVPVPTWGNHNKIFPLGGVPVKPYHYYDPTTRGLDYQGALAGERLFLNS